MGRSYLVVEGKGENLAVENLLTRLSAIQGRPDVFWTVRARTNALKQQSALIRVCERLRDAGDCDRAVLLQDDEDGCPRNDGPRMAAWVRALALPFPVAVVLFYREYETLFLPCLGQMAAKPLKDHLGRELAPLAPDASFNGDPEQSRDAKKIVSRFLPRTSPYQPTTHQLALTRLLDFDVLRSSGLPCFGTLERALTFVLDSTSGVYPLSP